MIALTSLKVVLNSGNVQTFQAGNFILFEDVVIGGHKLKGHEQKDMTVIILMMPQHYHQVGKDNDGVVVGSVVNIKYS